MGGDGELARGREAAGRLAWADAYTALSLADRSSSLAGEDLELLATAAYLLGRVEECLRALQRAQQRSMPRSGEPRRAARCAFWLTFPDQPGRARPGEWVAGPGQPPAGGRAGVRRARLRAGPGGAGAGGGRRLRGGGADGGPRGRHRPAPAGDADLVALALSVHGRATVRAGRVDEGLGLLDEAMVAVVSGELSAPVAGAVYCSVLDACQESLEWRRAQEWTAALAAWCDKRPDMVTFTGQCLVHRAEILQLHGAWPEAVEEARQAGERLALGADSYAIGAALYRQAEVYRVLGDFTAADDAYQRASRRGLEPQPGLALLRLAQGRAEVARRRSAGSSPRPPETFRRARLLPAQVEILLAVGEVEAAADAGRRAGRDRTAYRPALHAVADHGRGAVLLAKGDARAAVVALRAADQVAELDAPYEAARVRVLVGLGCRALGDEEAAAMELDAARGVFAQLGAAPDLSRLETLDRRAAASRATG